MDVDLAAGEGRKKRLRFAQLAIINEYEKRKQNTYPKSIVEVHGHGPDGSTYETLCYFLWASCSYPSA